MAVLTLGSSLLFKYAALRCVVLSCAEVAGRPRVGCSAGWPEGHVSRRPQCCCGFVGSLTWVGWGRVGGGSGGGGGLEHVVSGSGRRRVGEACVFVCVGEGVGLDQMEGVRGSRLGTFLAETQLFRF